MWRMRLLALALLGVVHCRSPVCRPKWFFTRFAVIQARRKNVAGSRSAFGSTAGSRFTWIVARCQSECRRDYESDGRAIRMLQTEMQPVVYLPV